MFLLGCLRTSVLGSGSQRVSRALGAARPSYLSGAISMWMLQRFGWGIFPHTGSHQSRLTGHWLHSITERPGLEKKKMYPQATDVQPETMHHPPPSQPHSPPNEKKRTKLQFPLLSGRNKSVQLPCFTPGSPASFLVRSNFTLHLQKRPNPLPQCAQRDTKDWQITWGYICTHAGQVSKRLTSEIT